LSGRNETTEQEKALGALTQAVLSSAKYRHVSQDLIRSIGQRELSSRRNLKQAIKGTKNRLHQVGGAYFRKKVDYQEGLALLRMAAGNDEPAAMRRVCRDLMRLHASTSERLDILDQFYATTLAGLAPVRTVLDIASGFNPLSLPWMPFDADVEYYAYDIYADMMAFIQEFLDVAGVKGAAEVRDVTSRPPTQHADLALLLKTLPCLEQIDKTAAQNLLDGLNAAYLLVSFPVHSLGGFDKGMAQHYEEHFLTLIEGRHWPVRRFEFSSELAFLVETGINHL
jgi:16S rRNA (guanine(1405)-N(7))-methyltransferase